jgi:hypothetical protein
MFNIFGNSTFGNIANGIVDSRIKSSPVGGLADYMSQKYGQSNSQAGSPDGNLTLPPDGTVDPDKAPTIKPIASADLQNRLGTTPSVPDTGMKPSGQMGIKKIIGMVYPAVGMALAKHDAAQAKQASFNKSMEGMDEPVTNPFANYV